jgi:hypothetical protein
VLSTVSLSQELRIWLQETETGEPARPLPLWVVRGGGANTPILVCLPTSGGVLTDYHHSFGVKVGFLLADIDK